MPEPTDIHALLAHGGRDDIAIAAPEREPLTYGGLREQVARTGEALGKAGIGAGERVAIVLANGPEMAAAFLGVAAHATAAPLNPAYRTDEFAFYLEDLRARALILEAGADGAAVEAAKRVGVPIIGLTPAHGAGAGCFTLDAPAGMDAANDGDGADDAALVLHTSGTTSRPKIVPLTGANLCASAANIAGWLALEPGDRCLNIMPLFHIHGLMAGVMASLHAGSTVVCTPGFNALRVFAWLDDLVPTWLTAVPTMHQAILARAAAQPRDRRAPPLAPAALVVVVAAGAGDGGAGGDLRCAGDRVLRHDRGVASDDQQPAAAGRAPAGRGGDRRRAASRDHGRGRHPAGAGSQGRGGDPRRQRHPRLREQPGGQRRGVRGRLVPHRRPGRDRRRRLPDAHRPAQGDHQPGRREDRAARGRRRADDPSGGRPGGRLRHAAPKTRRGRGGGDRAARGRRGGRARAARLRRQVPRRLQGAPHDPLPRRDPQGGDRQAAAHRPRPRNSGLET